MKYRKFGELEWESSALGFGIMRLPVKNRDHGAIDEEKALKIVRYAINRGVNYIDTAWNYHSDNSEGFVGRALSDGYREKVKLVTKMPCWLIETTDDLDRHFYTQMERLQVDRIDFYLLHALQRDWWEKMKKLDYIAWAEKKQADGVIGHLGFSFHDKFPLFKKIIDDYPGWTMTMVQHNYMDAEKEAGLAGIRYARDNGLAVVAMEPLRGGQLAKEPPSDVKALLEESVPGRSPAEWGLRWVLDQPEISLVLSGMSSMEQVEENLGVADEAGIGNMSLQEKETIDRAREAYELKAAIGCTDCRYCMPCPHGVAIPFVFSYYNMMKMYSDLRLAKAHYAFLDESSRADKCTGCGKCLEHCPQHLEIIELLKECHSVLKPEMKADDKT